MKAKDLPIYSSSIDDDCEYVLEPIPDSKLRSYLYSLITPTRKSIVHWYETAETNTQKSVKFAITKSTAIYKRINDDPVILARGGFITVCGLGGVVLGSRGGMFRQLAYGTLGTSIGAVMCYPSCSSKAITYVWDVGITKLIESSEILKRKFKE